MTAGPPAGGIRSLGASLLDDVLAETLDPAYAQAAGARAARGEQQPPPRWRGQLLVALALRDFVPVWLVALLVGRELVLGVMLLVLRAYGYPPLQVHYLGKAATFLLLYAFPGLLLADGDGLLATIAEPFAWAFTIGGTALYLLAGAFYVVQVIGIVAGERAARSGNRP